MGIGKEVMPSGIYAREPLEQRFWRNVLKTDSCWEWQGQCDSVRPASTKGMRLRYGRFQIKGKRFKAHRISWQMHFGPVPSGLNVLHKCDNPPCINPDHLFLGTTRDNSRDMSAKGRSTKLPGGCSNGHLPTDWVIWRDPTRRAERRCKACNRERRTK